MNRSKLASAFTLTLALTIGSSASIGYAALPSTAASATTTMVKAPTGRVVSDLKAGSSRIEYTAVPAQSDGMFHEGLLLASKADGSSVFYNAQGKEAFALPDHLVPLTDFHNQRALVQDTSTKLAGYINTQGKLVIPCIYTATSGFTDGIAFVKKGANDKGAFINPAGKQVTTLTQSYDSDYYFSEGLALASSPNGDKIGYLNKSGSLAIPYKYNYGRPFFENAAVVQDNKGNYGFINTKGKAITAFQYKAAGDFSEGLAPVQNQSGLWGYINTKGKVIIPFQYASAERFGNGLGAVYNEQGKAGYINTQGKVMIGYQYAKASPFNNGVAVVGIKNKSTSKFGYINTQGRLLTPLQYRQALSFNEGVAVASTSDRSAVLLSE
ncbi:WG repeat-containing protein [Paenibacillus bovis]|uniref:WG repeat-containing protein n=1 Tax=Paenibacillus bovis TaxID=1616788 RepID=A0A172ZI74_9BACL|nr:WG repeat-containing protein [Paenibacillus bovis]ANF97102.1 hypothetical protein AR543_14560 [Paenibacillus bovis]